MNKTAGSLALAAMFMAAGALASSASEKGLETLPDSAFASVETGAKGEKLRHLPYRDGAGHIDVKRLRQALRLWKRVKWQNPADAQPALAALKGAKSQACQLGKMKCGKSKSSQAKKGPRVKKAKKA